MERKEVFRALVGSHNYGLATPESDKDYKVFVMPTFDDLYKGERYAKSLIGEKEDLDVHDVRKLSNLFFKSNVNFLEVLFSNQVVMATDERHILEFVYKLFSMNDEIATMNLPYLYNVCEGMFLNKMKYLSKGTEGTQHLVDKYGYDTKQALHAYRILNFIVRLHQFDFDFEKAMKYEDEWQHYMLELKDGIYSESQFRIFVGDYYKGPFKQLKPVYMNKPVSKEAKEKLEQLIYDLVRKEITGGR